jgi:hypothetical protein
MVSCKQFEFEFEEHDHTYIKKKDIPVRTTAQKLPLSRTNARWHPLSDGVAWVSHISDDVAGGYVAAARPSQAVRCSEGRRCWVYS